MQAKVVFGLSVNTRMLGLAIISGNNLIDYEIQLRKEAWCPLKQEKILASLQPWFSSYNINSIAMSIPYENQTSSQTKELLESLSRYFTERNIPIYSYHIKALYTLCTENKAKTKKEVMWFLAHLYPGLVRYYKKEIGNKNKYYIKLFEAVGVATLHSQNEKEKS